MTKNEHEVRETVRHHLEAIEAMIGSVNVRLSRIDLSAKGAGEVEPQAVDARLARLSLDRMTFELERVGLLRQREVIKNHYLRTFTQG